MSHGPAIMILIILHGSTHAASDHVGYIEGLRFTQFIIALRDHMLNLTTPFSDRNLAVRAKSVLVLG